MALLDSLTINDLYNLYYGGKKIEDNILMYLPRKYDELPEQYEIRQFHASYLNLTKKIVSIYEAYVLYNDPKLTGKPNFDIYETAKQLIRHSLIAGECYSLAFKEGVKLAAKSSPKA